ncbi:MAG: hypothetical protein ACC648_05940, partial [Thiohalobacterales bacterium]
MNKIRMQVASCLFGAILLVGGNAFAGHDPACPNQDAYPLNDCSLPGIRDGSYPYFDNGVKVEYKDKKDGDFKIKAQQDNNSGRSVFLLDLDELFYVGKPKFKFTAEVKNGVLKKGSVKIQGIIQDLGITKKSTLMKADLEGGWTFSADGQLLGFNTTNIICHEAFAA